MIPISGVFLIPAFVGLLLSYASFPLGNAACWIARASLDVILGVARYGGSVTVYLPAPPAAAYLLWLAAMLFASRLCLRDARTRAVYACVIADAAVLLWLLL